MSMLLQRGCNLRHGVQLLNPAAVLPSTRRTLSFKEKQKRKLPEPKRFTQKEYETQYAIVQDLKQKSDAVTAEITPLQQREAVLRKKEYDLWMRIRAIKRSFLEGEPRKKHEYLQWELQQRAKRDKEERSGLRQPHHFKVLYW